MSRLALKLTTGSAIGTLAIALAMPAAAQDTLNADGTVAQSDQIVVTGTRIARDANEEAPSPVQSITAEEARQTGVVDVTEALREIPALSNSGTIADSLERGAGGVGQATLNLRGLGSERTLVVVDGKRHVSGVTNSQIVDVATIPNQLIERVEVLTGGASAVYGADAVTGVVNYVMKQDYEGWEINSQAGVSSRGDGFTADVSGAWGANFDDGRGNVTMAAGYSRIDEIQQGDRSYTRANARFNTGQTYPSPLRRFQKGDITASDTPNFFDYYTTDNGLFPYGFSIPLPGSAAYDDLFGAGATPTGAEQALIDQATNAPSLAFQSFPAFAISSNSGLIFRNDFGFFNADINNNGVNDCEESFIGFTGFGGGGCYVSTPGGGVKIFEDGIIASSGNQFGGDGAPERLSAASLIPENERYYADFIAHYEFSPAVEAFVDAKYVQTKTRSQNPYNTFYDSLLIFPDNPFIPAVLQADADEAGGLRVSRDFTDLGAANAYAKRDTFRIVGGVRGEVAPTINYEIYGNYGQTKSKLRQENTVLYDRLFAALDAVDEGEFLTGTANGNIVCRSDLDPTAVYPGSEFFPVIEGGFYTFNPGDGQCTPISLFNGENSVSAAGANFITTDTVNKVKLSQMVFGASLTGDTTGTFELPGGPIGFALGGEYRKEKSRFRYDPLELGIVPIDTPFANAGDFIGDVSGNQQLVFDAQTPVFNSGGSYDVWEVFGEVRVPILSDRPFFDQLEISGAARYSDYSTVGGTFTWNVGGVYAPIPDLKLRGTYAKAVRAPNISELFSPQQGTVFRPADPCDAAQIDALSASDAQAGAQRQANCVADGLPVGYTDPLTARFSGTTGGNPDLNEETARTYTFGAVIAPRFVPNLVISVDYYNIEIKDAIAAVSAQDIVDSCYDTASFPNQYCDQFTRNRDPGSPTFLGLNFLRQTQLNFGKIETAGIDASMRYRRTFGDWDVSLFANATWVDKLDFYFDPGDPSAVDPELREQGRPEWTATGGVSLGYGPLTLNYRLQWIDSQALGGVEIETADVVAGPAGFASDKYIHDASFNIEANDYFDFYGGVNNFTDVKPYPTNSSYPVSPYGRYFFVGARIKG